MHHNENFDYVFRYGAIRQAHIVIDIVVRCAEISNDHGRCQTVNTKNLRSKQNPKNRGHMSYGQCVIVIVHGQNNYCTETSTETVAHDTPLPSYLFLSHEQCLHFALKRLLYEDNYVISFQQNILGVKKPMVRMR